MRVLFFAALALNAAPAAASAQVCLYGGPNSGAACGPQYTSDREDAREDRDPYDAPVTSRAVPARPVTAQDAAIPPARFVEQRIVPRRDARPPLVTEAYGDPMEYEPLPTYGQDREPRLAGGPPPARLAAPPPRAYDSYLPAPRRERGHAGRGYYGRAYEGPEHRRQAYRDRGHYGHDYDGYHERRHARAEDVYERREYGYFYEEPRYEAHREYRLYRGGDYRYAPQRIYGRTLNPAAWGARVRQPVQWRDHDGYYFEERCYDRDPRGGWDHCESYGGPDAYPGRISLDAGFDGGVGGAGPVHVYGGGGGIVFAGGDPHHGVRIIRPGRKMAFVHRPPHRRK